MRTAFITGLLLALSLAVVKANDLSEVTDFAQSGNYAMYLCDSGQPNSQAAKLQTLLPYVWQVLQEVLVDVKLGTASEHGFRSFFKTNGAIHLVESIFQAIAEGITSNSSTTAIGPLILLGRDTPRGREQDGTLNPTIFCANPGAEGSPTQELYSSVCVDDTIPHTLAIGAMYSRLANIVVLCPAFWKIPTGLTAEACPTVLGSRRRRYFPPNYDGLIKSQSAALIHELVHLYMPFDDSEWDEEYDIQDLVLLNATSSVMNAQNYAAYAASVQAGCDDFPLPPTVSRDDGL